MKSRPLKLFFFFRTFHYATVNWKFSIFFVFFLINVIKTESLILASSGERGRIKNSTARKSNFTKSGCNRCAFRLRNSKKQKKKKKRKKRDFERITVPCSRNFARDKIIFIRLPACFPSCAPFLSRCLRESRIVRLSSETGDLKYFSDEIPSSLKNEKGGGGREKKNRGGLDVVSGNSCLKQCDIARGSRRKICFFNAEALINA